MRANTRLFLTFEDFEDLLRATTKGTAPLHVVGAECDNARGEVTLQVINFDADALCQGCIGFNIPFTEYVGRLLGELQPTIKHCPHCGKTLEV